MLRLFVGLDLPDDVRDRLSLVQGGVPDARWMRPETLHLTLRFVGEVDDGTAADLDAALGQVRAATFDLWLDGAGSFGPAKRPHSLHVLAARSDPLQALHDRVDRAVVKAGLAPDDRKFLPHVTVARMKGAPRARVERWLESQAAIRVGPIAVSSFTLFRSHLGREGADYEPLRDYPLRFDGG